MFNEIERNEHEYHAYHTLVFDDLLEEGYDWGGSCWTIPNYIDAEYARQIRARVNNLIEDTYRWREINNTVRFRHNMISVLSRTCSLYAREYLLYAADIKSAGKTKNRSRTVNSEYPQSQLSGANDYARDATDYADDVENELSDKDKIAVYKDLYTSFNDTDMKLVNAVDRCFRHFI